MTDLELKDKFALLGCLAVALFMFAVPVLTVLSFTLGWNPFLKWLLLIGSITDFCILASMLYALMEN